MSFIVQPFLRVAPTVIDEVVGNDGVRRIATTSTVQTGGWITGLGFIIRHPALACLQSDGEDS